MTKTRDLLACHRLTDHRERLVSDRAMRHDVVRFFVIARVDLPKWHEALDLNSAGVLRSWSWCRHLGGRERRRVDHLVPDRSRARVDHLVLSRSRAHAVVRLSL